MKREDKKIVSKKILIIGKRRTYISFHAHSITIHVYRAPSSACELLHDVNLQFVLPMSLVLFHDFSFPFQSVKSSNKIQVFGDKLRFYLLTLTVKSWMGNVYNN